MDLKDYTNVWVAVRNPDQKGIIESAASKMMKCYGLYIKSPSINHGFWHNGLYHCQVFFTPIQEDRYG